MVKPIIRVYAAGGMGMDLGSRLTNPLFDVAFLDVSDSNFVPEVIHEDRLHLVAGARKGSGGNRRINYEPIRREVPEFVQAYPPLDFNIILFSGSGGTGSTAGPLIAAELLKQQAPFIVVTLGDPSTKRWNDNALQTIKSLDNAAIRYDLPVVMLYHKNGAIPRAAVDEEILYGMNAIAYLAGQNNHTLDIEDVKNFVQYTTLTPLQPQLTQLHITDTRQVALGVVEPVSTASLYVNREEYEPFGAPSYTTYGFPRTGDLFGGTQLHFLINQIGVESIKTAIEERQQELLRTHGGYHNRKALTNSSDNVEDDGTVFD